MTNRIKFRRKSHQQKKQLAQLLKQWVEWGNGHLFAPPQVESEELLKELGVEFRELKK